MSGGSVTAVNVRAWYLSLHQPPAALPAVFFMPVWVGLFLLMAVAAWLVWRHPAKRRGAALTFWGWQLLLGAVWAPLFFGLHLLLVALCVCLAMLSLLSITIMLFRPLSPAAAAALLPGLLWAGFITYLNAGFWWLNR